MVKIIRKEVQKSFMGLTFPSIMRIKRFKTGSFGRSNK